jgi:hypothetical protein
MARYGLRKNPNRDVHLVGFRRAFAVEGSVRLSRGADNPVRGDPRITQNQLGDMTPLRRTLTSMPA